MARPPTRMGSRGGRRGLRGDEAGEVVFLGAGEVLDFDLLFVADGGADGAVGEGEVFVVIEGLAFVTGEGAEAEGLAAGVEEEDRAEAAGHEGEGLAGGGVEDGLELELGNEALAGGDEGLELAGLDAELPDEPEAADDFGGFGGEEGEDFLLFVAESGFKFAVDVDDADDEALDDHGDGHFGADGVLELVVAGIGADVGDDEGASVKGDPASDALAEGSSRPREPSGRPRKTSIWRRWVSGLTRAMEALVAGSARMTSSKMRRRASCGSSVSLTRREMW